MLEKQLICQFEHWRRVWCVNYLFCIGFKCAQQPKDCIIVGCAQLHVGMGCAR